MCGRLDASDGRLSNTIFPKDVQSDNLGVNISFKTLNTSSFEAGTTTSICQGIEEIGEDEDLVLCIVVTMQSLH
jgi:hypothetical protein